MTGIPVSDAYPPPPAETELLLAGAHTDPHRLLGAHPHTSGTVIRALRPGATAVTVVTALGRYTLPRAHPEGLFSGLTPEPPGDYRLEVSTGGGTLLVDDPYRWLPTLDDLDLHLITEGRHDRLWEVLGAHPREYETTLGTVSGTSFAVWAPGARGVRVRGDFDEWTGHATPLRSLPESGVWEVFLPGVGPGTRYGFLLLDEAGAWHARSDPMAFASTAPPDRQSVVTRSRHAWTDAGWVDRRDATDWRRRPVSVYEVDIGSWRTDLPGAERARRLVEHVSHLGFTHVELLPHRGPAQGRTVHEGAASLYAPDFGFDDPDAFRAFVDLLHGEGIGVILDWDPARIPTGERGLGRFDGSPLYERPRQSHDEPTRTPAFDHSRPRVRDFLVANARYWLSEFHVDGLHVGSVTAVLHPDRDLADALDVSPGPDGAEDMGGVRFLQEVNAAARREHPGVITVARESTSWPGVTRAEELDGLGFTFTWNLGWARDTLNYLAREPAQRRRHHHEIAFSSAYAWSEDFLLPLSHAEVTRGRGPLWSQLPGDARQKAAGLRALLAFTWAHPGKKLLFMGGEFGQVSAWPDVDSPDWSLLADPVHAGVLTLVADLNRAYQRHPALFTEDASPDGFAWLDANDHRDGVFGFRRAAAEATGASRELVCLVNFAATAHEDHRVGVPAPGPWREVLNTDDPAYGGAGVGNPGPLVAEGGSWHGGPVSVVLRLPASGVVWLAPSD